MKQPIHYVKEPESEKVKAYKRLFDKYRQLHDILGREHPTLSYIHK